VLSFSGEKIEQPNNTFFAGMKFTVNFLLPQPIPFPLPSGAAIGRSEPIVDCLHCWLICSCNQLLVCKLIIALLSLSSTLFAPK